jgi:hypothetical protein
MIQLAIVNSTAAKIKVAVVSMVKSSTTLFVSHRMKPRHNFRYAGG